jgi:hypothetical protein
MKFRISRTASAFILVPFLLFACAHRDDTLATGPAATIEKLEIVTRKHAFGGAAFASVGDYEMVIAVAHMKVDPKHPANRRIVDLSGAADADGWARYQTDVVIARPRSAEKASGVLLVEIVNRGRKLMLGLINEGALQADTAAQAGNGWLMRQGHTLVWVGWQGDIPLDRSGQKVGMTLPVVTNRGAPVTGTSLEEQIFDSSDAMGTMLLSYPAATPDATRAELSVRATPGAAATVLAPETWRYKSATEIELKRPSAFDAGAIYHFKYEARDPRPMGLGMAAVRDIVTFLKGAGTDAAGQAHPLADIPHNVTVAVGISQSGRFLRDFIWQGFNATPDAAKAGTRVFDGVMPTIAGSRKTFTNTRWAQPGRNSLQHEDHWTSGDQFPFGYGVITDPLTGRTDGIFARCRTDNTCPKVMQVDSNLEFWQARAALVVTDGAGSDVPVPDDVRVYLMSSTQHVAAASPAAGICQLPNNPAKQSPTYRAVLTRLIAWAREGTSPPASRYPSVAAGTLVPPQRPAMGFPDLSQLGMSLPTRVNELNVVDYSVIPPRIDTNRRYLVLVPSTDADGLDVAGVRVPDIEVPLATYSGFGLRKKGYAEGELCGLNGSHVPLAKDAAERNARNDPRPSIAERYSTRAIYVERVRASAERLRADDLMLEEDVARVVDLAVNDPRVQALPQ